MPRDVSSPLRVRPRRLRRSPAVRALVQETQVTPDDLIMPLFVQAHTGDPEPITAMPGQYRYNLDQLVAIAEQLHLLGIRAVALFPVVPPELKTPDGAAALRDDALVLQAVRKLTAAVPDLVVITDIALDPYTSHGHDGILTGDGRDVDNDRTVNRLADMAVLHASAGADWVAPSDMMDGRVAAIRAALDSTGHARTAILAYAAKFASAFYGPFREAVGSAQAAGTTGLDKRTYQINPANAREALRETRLDEQEGADLLMVKPAGPYLDVITRLRADTVLPVAAYQVSGEYAQIMAAAGHGWLDGTGARDEALLAIKRAGADLILTYFARAYAEDWAQRGPGARDYAPTGDGDGI